MKKILTKALKKIGKAMNNDRALNDLSAELQKRATATTSVYIEENMMNVVSCKNNFDVLSYALKHVVVEGSFLEFGVYNGSTINHISKIIAPKIVYGFDSFEGLPEFWRDGYSKGTFELKSLPKVNSNARLIKGWFDESLPTFIAESKENIAFLHVDCDLYSSTKTIFNLLADRIKAGTVIVFDEYFNYPGWREGEFKAFKEFVEEHKVQYEYLTYNRWHEQVAVLIKSISHKR